MLKIKLVSKGKIHQRTFRVVVAEARSKVNGHFVEDLGFYTPQTKTMVIDKDKIAAWVKKGAQLTIGVEKLLNPAKYPNKKKVKPAAEGPATTVAPTPVEKPATAEVSA